MFGSGLVFHLLTTLFLFLAICIFYKACMHLWLAYIGYPDLYFWMSLKRSMSCLWTSMCPPRTDLDKQTYKDVLLNESFNLHDPRILQSLHDLYSCIDSNECFIISWTFHFLKINDKKFCKIIKWKYQAEFKFFKVFHSPPKTPGAWERSSQKKLWQKTLRPGKKNKK